MLRRAITVNRYKRAESCDNWAEAIDLKACAEPPNLLAALTEVYIITAAICAGLNTGIIVNVKQWGRMLR